MPTATPLSRRDFLGRGLLAAAGLLLLDPARPVARALAGAAFEPLAPSAPRGTPPGGLRPVDDMTLTLFQRIAGDTVQLEAPGGERFPAQVSRVDDLSRGRGPYQQYSVLFHTQLQQAFPQGSYKVTHPREGACVLFLVPVMSREPGVTYEAVFTRPA